MVSFSKAIDPFISLNSCGDFAVCFECSDSFLICVGDIGGHGNLKIGDLHFKIEQLIKENRDSGIYEIFEIVKNIKDVNKYGLTFFIARINKALPLLQYICIGNLKLHLIKENKIKPLKKQNGVIGLELPVHIEHNVVKLHNNDMLIVATDGVNSYEQTLLNNIDINKDKDIHNLSQNIIDTYSLKEDDALCCVVKYLSQGSESYNFTKNPQQSRFKELRTSTPKKSEKIYLTKPLQKKSMETLQTIQDSENLFNLQSDIIPLKKEFLFVSLNSLIESRNILSQILKYLQFNTKQSIKTQTIVMEFLKNGGIVVDFYLSKSILQIHFRVKKNLAKKVIPLFYDLAFTYDELNNLLILQYPLAFQIDMKNEKLNDFKEMVLYGMSEENHKNYKKEQEYTTMIHQAKIAQMAEVISMIAHQWRQPLGSIGSAITNIQNKLALDKYDLSKVEDKNNFIDFLNMKLENISGYTDFLSKTIDDFRNFYKEGLSKESFLLNEPINNGLSIIEASLKNNRINLKLELDGSIEIFGFKNEFMQVILNIVKNAKDNFEESSIENKEITIKTYKDDRGAFVSIEDNGGGVPMEIVDKIFEPYFSTKEKKNGTGLGLYMSKMIIEEHHKGRLSVVNKGSCAKFLLEIPINV